MQLIFFGIGYFSLVLFIFSVFHLNNFSEYQQSECFGNLEAKLFHTVQKI